jgi:hypothetical protein
MAARNFLKKTQVPQGGFFQGVFSGSASTTAEEIRENTVNYRS